MSSAHILANQAGLPAGEPSVSRRDLALGTPVYLSNASDEGVRSHRWRMVDRPTGSTAIIANKTSAVAQFTPDVAGSYLVELQVDEALPGQVDRRVFAVLTDFGGLSPRPLRIPASGEDDEANWMYDFGPTTAANKRGWMPDFVELILYAGLLAGPASALALVLIAGNTTGGTDVLLSAGDALRGAPGEPATVVGGEGVNGGAVLVYGADSLGPVGTGGDATVRSGDGAGGGVDGTLTLEGGNGAALVLDSVGAAALTSTAAMALSSGGAITETATTTLSQVAGTALSQSAGTTLSQLAAGDLSLVSTAGEISLTAGTNVVEEALGVHSTRAGGEISRESTGAAITDIAATSMSTTTGTNWQISVGGALAATCIGTATLSASSASITASAGITEAAGATHTITAADIVREATNSIFDNAGVTYDLLSGDITLTADVTASIVATDTITLASPELILPTADTLIRGTDGAAPTGFHLRGGNGTGAATAGSSLTLSGGDSTGAASGSSVTISPGAVSTGTRGRVKFTHDGRDTEPIEDHTTTGTNGASVSTLVGTQNPSVGAVDANCGDFYHRDTGAIGEAYVKSSGNGNPNGWHKIGNTTLFARSTIAVTTSATAAETSLANFTVPGGALGSTGTLIVRAVGSFMASVVASSFTLRIKFGGVTIYQDVTPSIGPSAAVHPWYLDIHLCNANNLASQGGGGSFTVSAPNAAAVGYGALGSALSVGGPIRFGVSAADTSSDQSLQITIQHSSSNAGTQTVRTAIVGILSLS